MCLTLYHFSAPELYLGASTVFTLPFSAIYYILHFLEGPTYIDDVNLFNEK